MKITKEHSEKIEALISQKTFTLQDVVSLLDNLYTDNQIKYHINKFYPQCKKNLCKEYSKGGTKLEYILKSIFPSDKIESEFPLGEKLRVDFVVHSPYNLAFEFDGSQHSSYSSFFHGSKGGFTESQNRDSRKEVLLANRGINLIRIDNLDISVFSLNEIISSVGYGSGIVVDKMLLTTKEKTQLKQQEFQKLLKQSRSQGGLVPKQQKQQVTEKTLAYKNSIKDKQKIYRKEQYEKQKQWLKENRKK